MTPKIRQIPRASGGESGGSCWVMVALIASVVIGSVRLVAAWAVFDLIVLSVVLTAARHRAPETQSASLP